MQLNLGKVKGEDGTNVYVKYNSSPSDTGAADFWSQGQDYIGVLSSASKIKPTNGYTWTKFVGDNGIDGKNCYIKYNTIANDSGATTNWTVGQDYIGFVLSNAATAPTSGYTWSRFIPERTAMPTSGSTALFTAGGAYTALAGKEMTISVLPITKGGTGNSSVDSAPMNGSSKMVTSGGIYAVLSDKISYSNIIYQGTGLNLSGSGVGNGLFIITKGGGGDEISVNGILRQAWLISKFSNNAYWCYSFDGVAHYYNSETVTATIKAGTFQVYQIQ